MGAICDLEDLQGLDLGQSYKNRQACSVSVEYIAQDQWQQLACALVLAFSLMEVQVLQI